MNAHPLTNMICAAKAICIVDSREQCAPMARRKIQDDTNRTVIFNKDRLDKIKKNTLKIHRAEKEIDDMYIDGGFFINI